MVFPVVLGTGKRLFGDTDELKRLRLTRSTVVGDEASRSWSTSRPPSRCGGGVIRRADRRG